MIHLTFTDSRHLSHRLTGMRTVIPFFPRLHLTLTLPSIRHDASLRFLSLHREIHSICFRTSPHLSIWYFTYFFISFPPSHIFHLYKVFHIPPPPSPPPSPPPPTQSKKVSQVCVGLHTVSPWSF